MATKKKWIQSARQKMERKGTVGSLRKALGVKQGDTISAAQLEKAAHSANPAIRKKANFAKNVRKRK